MAKTDVYYNNGKNLLFITAVWTIESETGDQIEEATYSIPPGQGLDLSILGLSKEKDNDNL